MAKLLAALGLVANAFAWGVSWWPFRELQALGVHPLWATALIYCIALVSLAIVRPHAWRPMLKSPLLWCLLLSSGLTNVGFNWAVTVGDVVRVVLLFYLMPAWVVLLAWPLLGERPTAASLGRLLLALLGVIIVLKKPGTDWPVPESLPDWLALMGGFSFALTNVLLRKLHAAPPATHMLAMFGGGALMASLAAVLGMQAGMVSSLPALASPWLLWLTGMAVFILAGNLGLQYGASRLPANVTSIVMLTEIVFASVSAVLLGAAEWDTRTLVGGGLVVLASLLSALPSTSDSVSRSEA